jgi:hypothetical protein
VPQSPFQTDPTLAKPPEITIDPLTVKPHNRRKKGLVIGLIVAVALLVLSAAK